MNSNEAFFLFAAVSSIVILSAAMLHDVSRVAETRKKNYRLYQFAMLVAPLTLVYLFISSAIHKVSAKPPMKRPPIGLIPKSIHDQTRLEELLSASKRYLDAGLPINSAWLKEMVELKVVCPPLTREQRKVYEMTAITVLKLMKDYPTPMQFKYFFNNRTYEVPFSNGKVKMFTVDQIGVTIDLLQESLTDDQITAVYVKLYDLSKEHHKEWWT